MFFSVLPPRMGWNKFQHVYKYIYNWWVVPMPVLQSSSYITLFMLSLEKYFSFILAYIFMCQVEVNQPA